MVEVSFDGLVGLTHFYGGLSYGNRASSTSKSTVSSPKQGALQGLKKAKALSDLGIPQGILPIHARPELSALRNLGFTGSDSQVIEKAFKEDPTLLSICFSSSFMWTANAATVAPSQDTLDGKVHLTSANLRAKPHRSIEHLFTYKSLNCVFPDREVFTVHPALELGEAFSDEGAANHTRFENPKTGEGLHFFVYGRKALDEEAIRPIKYPARQTLEASQAIARVNNLRPDLCYFVQQNPEVIDAGVFHNDVISVGCKNVFLYHEKSFVNTEAVIETINKKLGHNLIPIKVTSEQVSVEQAVKTYLFNSQLVSINDSEMALVAPENCKLCDSTRDFIDSMIKDPTNPVSKVLYFDLLQSMKNGGGPACLRLRVQLTKDQLLKVNQGCLLSSSKYDELTAWVSKHYRDELTLNDLRDPSLLLESRKALDELSNILNVQNLYSTN